MHEVGGSLEYDGIGDLDTACIAGWHDARGARNLRGRPDQGAKRDRCLPAYCSEVAKAHGGRLLTMWSPSMAMKNVGGGEGMVRCVIKSERGSDRRCSNGCDWDEDSSKSSLPSERIIVVFGESEDGVDRTWHRWLQGCTVGNM